MTVIVSEMYLKINNLYQFLKLITEGDMALKIQKKNTHHIQIKNVTAESLEINKKGNDQVNFKVWKKCDLFIVKFFLLKKMISTAF